MRRARIIRREAPCATIGRMDAVARRGHRVRLDQLLVERGLAPTRARAQTLLLAGRVRVGEGDAARLDRKPGDLVGVDVGLEVREPEPYVSRGGYKLAAALDAFGIDPTGRVCLDVGASTGGFTDVLLKRGATRVYALDVGRGQLAASLARDPRVISMERTNARHLRRTDLPEPVDLAVIDVSFISLRLILEPVAACVRDGGDVVALVKPQFEAGRGHSERGVVRDPAVHRAVVTDVLAHARGLALQPRDVIASPITGPEGNREFLLHATVGGGGDTAPADLAGRLDEVIGA